MINKNKTMFSVTHISWGLPLTPVQALQAQNRFLRNFNLHYAAATARWDSGCLGHFKFKERLPVNAFGALSVSTVGTGHFNSHIFNCKKPGYMKQNIWRVA